MVHGPDARAIPPHLPPLHEPCVVARVSRPAVPRASRPACSKTPGTPFTKADLEGRGTAGRNACAPCHDTNHGPPARPSPIPNSSIQQWGWRSCSSSSNTKPGHRLEKIRLYPVISPIRHRRFVGPFIFPATHRIQYWILLPLPIRRVQGVSNPVDTIGGRGKA